MPDLLHCAGVAEWPNPFMEARCDRFRAYSLSGYEGSNMFDRSIRPSEQRESLPPHFMLYF